MPYLINNKHIVPVIEIKGRFLGSLERQSFSTTIEELKAKGTKSIVVDLSRTDMIDSSGIGVLIAAFNNVKEEGGSIRLSGVEKRVRSVFVMSKLLGTVFHDFETIEEAVQSFMYDLPPHANHELV